MTDKLTVYNDALGHLSSDRLRALTDSSAPRRALDDYWRPTVLYCLERKFWNFGYRTVQIDRSQSVVPLFGYAFAFKIPDDWVRTRKLSAVETLDPPLLQVAEETGYWFANVTPLFVQYNSNHDQYGFNLGAWPESFADYVGLRLAIKACKRVTGSESLLEGPEGLLRRETKAYRICSSICAMNEPIGFAPMGRWASSRRTGPLRGDGGPPHGGSLIG